MKSILFFILRSVFVAIGMALITLFTRKEMLLPLLLVSGGLAAQTTGFQQKTPVDGTEKIALFSEPGGNRYILTSELMGAGGPELNGIYTSSNSDSIVASGYNIRLTNHARFTSTDGFGARVGINGDNSGLLQNLVVFGTQSLRWEPLTSTTPMLALQVLGTGEPLKDQGIFTIQQASMVSGNEIEMAVGRAGSTSMRMGYHYVLGPGSFGYLSDRSGVNNRKVILWDGNRNVELLDSVRSFAGATRVIRVKPVGTLPNGSALVSGGLMYSHTSIPYWYDSTGVSRRMVGLDAYGEIYRETASDTIDISGPTHTLLGLTQELAQGVTTTDSTIIIGSAGVYEIKFASTWFWTENDGSDGAAVQFEAHVDDVFLGNGALFSQAMHNTLNRYQSGSFAKTVSLSASDVVKVKVTGGGTTNSIRVYSCTFSVKKLN